MHAKSAAFLIIGHGLDHRSKNVGVDLGPVEAADVGQIPLRDLGKPRGLGAAGKQPAVHIGKPLGPAGQTGPCPVGTGRIHCTEDFADDLMCVGAITF